MYPNTVANFTVRLPSPVKLEGSFEVALAEVFYTKSWLNINHKSSGFLRYYTVDEEEYFDFDDEEVHPRFTSNPQIRYIPQGFYTSPNRLIRRLNDLKTGFIFDIDNKNRTRITPPKNDEVMIEIPPVLFGKLGFTSEQPNRIYANDNPITSFRTINLNCGDELMYMYCDILEPQIVCDSKTKLLRIIPFSTEAYGGIVSHVFNPVHYVTVAKSEFHDITVSIYTPYGQEVSFQTGLVTVKLHFRRKQR